MNHRYESRNSFLPVGMLVVLISAMALVVSAGCSDADSQEEVATEGERAVDRPVQEDEQGPGLTSEQQAMLDAAEGDTVISVRPWLREDLLPEFPSDSSWRDDPDAYSAAYEEAYAEVTDWVMVREGTLAICFAMIPVCSYRLAVVHLPDLADLPQLSSIEFDDPNAESIRIP